MRILCLTLSVLLFSSSCRFSSGKRIRGNGLKATEERQLSNFTGIHVSGAYDVNVYQADAYRVQVTGDRNLLEYVDISQEGNVIKVRSRSGINLRPRHAISVTISAPRFDLLRISGSGDITAENGLSSAKEVNISISGSGDVAVNRLDAPAVRTKLTGSGDINLDGKTRNLYIDLSGSGDVHAYGLKSESADVTIKGSGNAEVFASRQLRTMIAGSGEVLYKGEPALTERKAGSGNVRKVE